MKLYLDTEFTDLHPEAKLISIALVDENEEYFYAELTDTYEISDCSPFVKSFVLPFLKGGAYRMTYNECALKIADWIENRGYCMLACGNPQWDLPYLYKLLKPMWPTNLEPDMVYPVRVPAYMQEDLVLEFNYDIHNALDDALVMKKATELLKK